MRLFMDLNMTLIKLGEDIQMFSFGQDCFITLFWLTFRCCRVKAWKNRLKFEKLSPTSISFYKKKYIHEAKGFNQHIRSIE